MHIFPFVEMMAFRPVIQRSSSLHGQLTASSLIRRKQASLAEGRGIISRAWIERGGM
jgi:hypothetical protein